jgi:isocitrate/isopropylmalate dehydrogenase
VTDGFDPIESAFRVRGDVALQNHRIAVIAGDGIGPEVTREAIRVADAAAPLSQAKCEWTYFPWGTDHYFQHGRMAPADYLDTLAKFDAILLGAVGHPDVQDHVTLNGLLLPIRRRFDQFICLRPSYLYPGVESPLRDKAPGSIDMLVFRENTEGEYAGSFGYTHKGLPSEVATQVMVYSREGTERIIRYAFELARTRKRKMVTALHKEPVYRLVCGMFARECRKVAAEYPDVEFNEVLIDGFALKLVMKPQQYDVVVTTNQFGDILTDEGAGIVGGLGLAPGLCVGERQAMAQATHGSAPDIAGRNIADPYAMIMSGKMLFEWLGRRRNEPKAVKAAELIDAAMDQVIAEAKQLTADLGGKASTSQMGDAVVQALRTRGR